MEQLDPIIVRLTNLVRLPDGEQRNNFGPKTPYNLNWDGSKQCLVITKDGLPGVETWVPFGQVDHMVVQKAAEAPAKEKAPVKRRRKTA